MLGYFGVSIIRWNLTWTTGSLTCVCHLFFACVCTQGTSIYSLIRRTFVESAQHLTPRKSQGVRKAWLACICHPSMWWPRLTVLNFGFLERVLLCTTDSPLAVSHMHPANQKHSIFASPQFTWEVRIRTRRPTGRQKTLRQRCHNYDVIYHVTRAGKGLMAGKVGAERTSVTWCCMPSQCLNMFCFSAAPKGWLLYRALREQDSRVQSLLKASINSKFKG